MMGYVFSGLITLADSLCAVVFFDAFFERRYKGVKFWRWFAGCTAVFAVALYMPFAGNSLLKMLLAILLFTALNLCLYHGKTFFRLMMAVVYYAVLCSVETLVISAALALSGLELVEFQFSYSLFITTTIITHTAMALLCYLVKRIHPLRAAEKLSWQWCVAPTLIPLAGLCIGGYMLYAFQQGNIEVEAIFVINIFVVIISVFSVVLVDWLQQNTSVRAQAVALEAKVSAQSESIEALSVSYAAQRKLTHDFRAHLEVLDALLAQRQLAQASSYVQELRDQHSERILLVNTRNPLLDALLNQKALAAQKQRVDIQFTVNDLSALRISRTDLTVIISNLLDNAIEASVKLPQSERRIQVKVLLEDAFFFSVKNRTLPVKIENGSIRSTKPDALLHGYGLRSVQTVLDKYPAYHAISYEDGWFTTFVEMPNTLHS